MGVKVWKLSGSLFVVIFVLSAASTVHVVHAASTITVGSAPWGVAYDSGKAEIFVVSSGSGTVSVLSDSNYAVLASVIVGQSPYRDLYDPGKGEVFVANYGANSVSVISDSNNTVVATVQVGTSPSSFAYDSAKGEIFVANSGASTVSVISDSNNTVVATVQVGTGPYDLGYDSATREVFVANAYSRSVSVISDSTNQVIATVNVGSGPLGVAYDSAKGEVYVANSVSGTVSVISDSNNTVVATVQVGTSPGATIYDADKGEIFVLDRASASVSVISDTSNTVLATVSVGTKPYGAAYDSAKGEIFVANEGDGTVSVISDSYGTSTQTSSTSSVSISTAQTTTTSSAPDIVQQVWVPKPASAVAAIAIFAVAAEVVSLGLSRIDNPLGERGGKTGEKTKGIIPDSMKDWLGEDVSSRLEIDAKEKISFTLRPTRSEALAYITSIVVLALSFSYVKVSVLSQIWQLLPAFFATSILVGFAQKFFSILFLRSRGVWSEHRIWPVGLVLYLFSTFAFKVPFSSPTRSVHQSKKLTERLCALASASEIIIGLAFAGLFFLLLREGYAAIGGAGLAMCVIGSFSSTFPVAPMSGRDIFDYSRSLWAAFFITTMVIFGAWLLLV